MLNNQPSGDLWHLQDKDPKSQYYGRIFHFDFSYIHSTEIQSVLKDYVWQNYKSSSKTLSTLQLDSRFKYFVAFAQTHNISSFKNLNHSKVELFLSYLRTIISDNTGRPLSYKSQKCYFDSLKGVISWCRIHRPNDVPSGELFTGNEFTRVDYRVKIDFIPDDILSKINIALKNEGNPYIKYGIIILESTGMRLGDLLKLRIDCIKPHLISGYTISWFDHKNRKERPPLPVRSECVEAVRHLIDTTASIRAEATDNSKDLLFIHRCPGGHHIGQVIPINKDTIRIWLKKYTLDHGIFDTAGKPYNLSTHQFRRTLGTDMLSKNIDLNVIQQVLGHSRPSTTKRFYADVKDKERAEIFRDIGIIGNIDLVDDLPIEDISEKEWFQANKHKRAALCDGYCTKPIEDGKVCDRLLKRHKCYSCSRYITTPEYLQTHRDHLARLEKQLEEGAIYGEHYAEHFRPTMEVLKVIIERLEELQHGRDESSISVTDH